MTKSELLFEKFCQSRGIPFKRIPPGSAKSPDYNIWLDSVKIAIEVKEITPNPKDAQKVQEFQSLRTVTIKSALGKRVSGKITAAAGKFKDASQDRQPSVLVLYNDVKIYKYTDPFDILAGMYGQLYFPVDQAPEGSLRIGEMRSGPKKKMTQHSNTSISCVGVLKESSSGETELLIYHNLHAKVSLNPGLLARFKIRQYRVNDPSNPTGWMEIESSP